MKRGDDVVVFLPGLVIEKRPLGSLLDRGFRDRLTFRSPLNREIENIQRCPRIPVGEKGNRPD